MRRVRTRDFTVHCVNAVRRKCEYGVLFITNAREITSHESKTSDLKKIKHHTHISELIVFAL